MKKQFQTNIRMIINIVISLVVIGACAFLLPKVIVFFMPFVIGWVIACIANPLVQFLESKLKIKRKAGTVVVSVLVIAGVIGAGYGIIVILARQLQGFIASIPEMWEGLEQDIADVGSRVNMLLENLSPRWMETLNTAGKMIGESVKAIPSNLESFSFNSVGSMVGSIANMIISVIMCMLSAYFFIAERDYVFSMLRKWLPKFVYERYGIVYQSLKQAVGGYFKAQFKIEVWIYFLILIGLSILKVKYAILIALVIAFLDLLPFFGSGIVLLPWAVIRIISGDYLVALGFLVIWGASQLVRQLIQPKIMGDSIGMAPVPTLFLLFIGYRVAGVVGMIFAVPIGIIVVNMNDAGLFDTLKFSIKILVANLNKYRRLTEEDLSVLNTDKSKEDK